MKTTKFGVFMETYYLKNNLFGISIKLLTIDWNVWNTRDMDSIRILIKISAFPVIKDSHLLHCWLIFWLLRININHKRLCWISKSKNAEIENRPLLHFLRSDFYILSFSSLRLYRRMHPLPTNCLHCLSNLPCFQSLSRIKTKRHKSIDV